MKKFLKAFFFYLFVFAGLFFCLSLTWGLKQWANNSFDEILYYAGLGTGGASKELIRGWVLNAWVPGVVLTLAVAFLQVLMKKRNFRFRVMINAGILFLLLAGVMFFAYRFMDQYDAVNYVSGQLSDTEFVKDNYVDPAEVEITFPEEKRNLIYIFLESVEMTYADESVGGAFSDNLIPELTELALSGECFSGSDSLLNGAVAMPGATYTTGAMVAQTSGLPVVNDMGLASAYQDSFYPGATCLGDLLSEAGYTQELMVGSDAVFGGRELYFSTHGDYTIFDYDYALEAGYIPEDYYEFWGYEDEKLFSFAKEELLRLSDAEEPFNFTMLTVDTHFEDGYVCRLCEDTYDDQYANVMACSSRQVSEFVSWIMEQDFYENTTVVICGDHPTMDSDFCEDVEDDYLRRTYTVILNSAAETVSTDDTVEAGTSFDETASGFTAARQYTTFDMFPTTLAALGVTISGDRLGLGTNLYAGLKTLLETYGYDDMKTELSKKTDLSDLVGAWNPYNFYSIFMRMQLWAYEDEGEACLYGVESLLEYPEKIIALYMEDELLDRLEAGEELSEGKTAGGTLDYFTYYEPFEDMTYEEATRYAEGIAEASREADGSYRVPLPEDESLHVYFCAVDSEGMIHLLNNGFICSGPASPQYCRAQDEPELYEEEVSCGVLYEEDASGDTLWVEITGITNAGVTLKNGNAATLYLWDQDSLAEPTAYDMTLYEDIDSIGIYGIDLSEYDLDTLYASVSMNGDDGGIQMWRYFKVSDFQN